MHLQLNTNYRYILAVVVIVVRSLTATVVSCVQYTVPSLKTESVQNLGILSTGIPYLST